MATCRKELVAFLSWRRHRHRSNPLRGDGFSAAERPTRSKLALFPNHLISRILQCSELSGAMGFALNRRIERLMTPTRRIPSGGGFFINPRESTAGFCLRDEDSLRLHRLFPCAVTGPWAGLEI
jgi:hypothetical protein